MRGLAMKPLHKYSLAGVVLLAAAGAVLWQRETLRELRDENTRFVAAQEEAAGLAEQNQTLEKLRELLPQVEALKTANRELPGLRNQARQMREANAEMEKLRGENQRLTAPLQGPTNAARSITEMEGFVAKEHWARGGFDTPEAALQNLFWAMREGNFEAFISCMIPEGRETMNREHRNEAETAKVMEEMRGFVARVKGFRISSKTEEPGGVVVLGLQVAAGGELMKVPLQRVGQEWKVRSF
jgi:hypothetical protein